MVKQAGVYQNYINFVEMHHLQGRFFCSRAALHNAKKPHAAHAAFAQPTYSSHIVTMLLGGVYLFFGYLLYCNLHRNVFCSRILSPARGQPKPNSTAQF